MKEELIQNDKSICIKRTIPLFEKEEIDNINENFIDIVNEYSKMLVKDKEQKTIQLLMKRQNEEIERLKEKVKEWKHNATRINNENNKLNSIIKELKIKFYETFRIKQNGSYTITETDYKDIEEILNKVGEE